MLLVINGNDITENITDGNFHINYQSITENNTEFTNIYGESKGNTVIGNKVTVTAAFENVVQSVVESIYAAKKTADNGETPNITAMIPGESNVKFNGMEVSFDYNYTDEKGVNRWNGNITLTADCVPVSGL